MQERVRAVEFVLARCGVATATIAKPSIVLPAARTVPAPAMKAVESWPYALVDSGDHEA